MLFVLLMTCCLGAPAEVILDTETITLGAILPLPASDARAGINLGRAPTAGLARRIPNYEIASRIQSAGLSSEGLEIPDSILVRRRAQSLDKEQLRRTVLDAFVRQFPSARIDLIDVDVPAVDIATGPISLTASLPPRFDAKLPVFARLDIRGGNFYRTVYVRTTARIEVLQPVVRTHVAANSEILPEQVEWTMAAAENGEAAPSSFEEFKGMLAKRDLEPGQVLTRSVLYLPLYVHKGETVAVRAVSGAVAIAATMRARASGRLGETVAVEHLTGEGSVTARVVGPRMLEAF